MNSYIYNNLFGLKTTVEDTSYVVYNLYLRRIRKLQSSGAKSSGQNAVIDEKASEIPSNNGNRVCDDAESTARRSENRDVEAEIIPARANTDSSIPLQTKDNPFEEDHNNNTSTTTIYNSGGADHGVFGGGSGGSRRDSSNASSSPRMLLSPNVLGSTQIPNLPERYLLEEGQGRTSKESSTTESKHDLRIPTVVRVVENKGSGFELLHEDGEHTAEAELSTRAKRSTPPPPAPPRGIHALPPSVSLGFVIPFMTLVVDLEQLALSSTSQRLSKMRQAEALLFSLMSGRKVKHSHSNSKDTINHGDGSTLLLESEKGCSLRSSAAREEVDALFTSAKRLVQSLAELSTFLPEVVYAAPLPKTLCPPSERIGLQSSTREALSVVKRLRAELEEALNVINAFVEAEEDISSSVEAANKNESVTNNKTSTMRDEDERVRTVAYDLSEQLYNDILLPRIAVAESILAARVALALRLPEYTRFAARMIHNTFLITIGEDNREEDALIATTCATETEEGGPTMMAVGENKEEGREGKVKKKKGLLLKEKTRALCFSPLLQESYRRSEGDRNFLCGGRVSACTCTCGRGSAERTASLLPIPLSWITSDLLDEAEAVLEEAEHTGNYSSLASAPQQKQRGTGCGGDGGQSAMTEECCPSCRARNQYTAKNSLVDSRKSFIALRVLVVEVPDEARALLDAVLVLHTLFVSLHEEEKEKDTSGRTSTQIETKGGGERKGGVGHGQKELSGLLARLAEKVDSGHLSFSNTVVMNNATMRNNKAAASGQQFSLTASSSIVSRDPFLEEICGTLLSFDVRDAESWLEDEVRNTLKSYIRRLRETTSTCTNSAHSSSSLRKRFSFGSSSKAVDTAGAVPSGGTPPSALKKSKSRRAEDADSSLRNGEDGRGLSSTPTRQQQAHPNPHHQQLQRTLSGTFSTPRKKLHMPSSSSSALKTDAQHYGEQRSDTEDYDDDTDDESEDSIVLEGTSSSLVFASRPSQKKERARKAHHGRDALHNKLGKPDGGEGSVKLLGASEYLSMHGGLPQGSRGAHKQQRVLAPAEGGEESPSSFPSFVMNQSSSLSSTRHYHADDVSSLIDRLDAIMGTPAPQGVSESVALATKLYDVLGRLNMFLRRAGLSKETRVTQTGKVVPVVVDVGGGASASTPSPNRSLSFGSRSALLRAVGGGDASSPSNPTSTTNAAISSSVAQPPRVYLEHSTDEALGFGRRESVLYEQACLCYEQWTAQNAVRMEFDSLLAMSDEEFYTACDARGMLADLFARADAYCVAGGDDVTCGTSATPRDLVVKRVDTLLITRIKAFHHSGEVRVLTVPQRCTFKHLMENRLARFFPDILTAGDTRSSHNYMYGCEVSFLDDGDKVRISSNEEFAELIALRRRIVIDTFSGPSLLAASSSSMHLGSSQFLGRSQLLTKCLTASSELKIELYLDPLPTSGRGGRGGGGRGLGGKGNTATAEEFRRGNAGPVSFVSSPPKAPKPTHHQESYRSASNTLLLEEETKRIGLNELIRRQEAEEEAQQRTAGVNKNNKNSGDARGAYEEARKLNLNGADLSRVSLGTNNHFHEHAHGAMRQQQEHRSSREADTITANTNTNNSTLYSLNTTDGVELFFQRKMIEKGLAPPPTTTNSSQPLASPSNSLPTTGERGIRQALQHIVVEDRSAVTALTNSSGGAPQPPSRHSPQTIRNMFLAMGRARKDAEVLSSGGVGRGNENTTATTADASEKESKDRTTQVSDNDTNATKMNPQLNSQVPLASRAGTSSVVVVDALLSEDARRKGWRVPPNPTLYSRDRPLIPQLNQSASESNVQQRAGERGGHENKKPGPLLSLSTVVIADLNESDADDEEMEALIGHPTWRRGETREGRPLTSVDHIHAVMYGRPPLNPAQPTPPTTASQASSSSPKARIATNDQLRFNGPLRKNGVPLPQQAKGRAPPPNVNLSSPSSRPSTTPPVSSAATATGEPPKTGGKKK